MGRRAPWEASSRPRPTMTTTAEAPMAVPPVAGGSAIAEEAGATVAGEETAAAVEAGCSPAAALREEVYELEVLELGGQGGGELGAVARLAHASGDLQESPDGAGEGDVSAP